MPSSQTRFALVTSSLLLAGSLAACSSDDGPSVTAPTAPPSTSTPAPTTTQAPTTESTTPPSTSSSSSSTTTTAPRKPFATGQCLGPKPAMEQVSCAKPHTYEVFFARPDATSAGDATKRSAWETATCNTQASKFFGSGSWVVSRLGVRPMTPGENPSSKSQVACVTFELRESLKGTVTNVGSFRGTLIKNYPKYQVCLKGKASAARVEFVSCREPHVAEGTGGRLWGGPGSPYPGTAKIHAVARQFCGPIGRAYLGAARSDVTYAENSGEQSNWARGQMVSGCFVEVKTGTVKKVMRGIGKKPLASYR